MVVTVVMELMGALTMLDLEGSVCGGCGGGNSGGGDGGGNSSGEVTVKSEGV